MFSGVIPGKCLRSTRGQPHAHHTTEERQTSIGTGWLHYRAVQQIGTGPPGQLGWDHEGSCRAEAGTGGDHRVLMWITPGEGHHWVMPVVAGL